MDYMDYPTVEFVVLENPLTISAETLRKIIHQTVFATSTSESNPILTGVNFNLKNNTLTCIATDSYRLSQTKLSLNDNYNDFLKPIFHILMGDFSSVKNYKICENIHS